MWVQPGPRHEASTLMSLLYQPGSFELSSHLTEPASDLYPTFREGSYALGMRPTVWSGNETHGEVLE